VNRRDAFAPDLRDQAYTAAKNQSRNEDVVSKEKWTFIPNEARERCATIFVEQHRASNQIKSNQTKAAQRNVGARASGSRKRLVRVI
jgi:hypothetical protein